MREDGAGYNGHACHVVFTREEVDADIWIETHKRHIVKVVDGSRDVALLKQIADVVGYDERSAA